VGQPLDAERVKQVSALAAKAKEGLL